ncbi:HEWD family protein [Halovenus sp. HT40]|uniref:HEWD family protein n=1 Tax=Halovenus sp. HT40 TaxID=3126691 RepID=UPI00300E8EED
MSAIEPPTERTCERCGRVEEWDEDQQTFVAASDDSLGQPHCLHEWDINGQYNPLQESES